jgi:hypothetical protein
MFTFPFAALPHIVTLPLCYFVNNPTDTENANPQEAFSLQKYKKKE